MTLHIIGSFTTSVSKNLIDEQSLSLLLWTWENIYDSAIEERELKVKPMSKKYQIFYNTLKQYNVLSDWSRISCLIHFISVFFQICFLVYYHCCLQCNDVMAWTNHEQVKTLWRALEEQQGQAFKLSTKCYSCATIRTSTGSVRSAVVTLLSDQAETWDKMQQIVFW